MQPAEIKEAKALIERIYLYPHLLGNMLGYSYLQEEHSRWIHKVWNSGKDVTLMAFRGSYKTTAISVVGTAWWIFFHPDHRVLLASSTHDNAKKIHQEVRSLYTRENMLMLYRLLDVYEPRDMEWWTKESMRLTTKGKPSKEGSVEAVGAGTVLTMRHYDRIICDDLVVLKDRLSKAERDRKKDWVRELQSVIEPDGHIGYVGTPWHPDDVYSITPPADKYPIGTVFNPKLTPERLKEIRRMQGEAFYASQYELKHISAEDMIFDDPHYGAYVQKGYNDNIKIIAYLDPAFGGADFSALTIGFVKEGRVYVKFGKIWRAQIDETYNITEKFCRKFQVSRLWVESNSAAVAIAAEFRRRGLHVREIKNLKNKHLRIMDNAKKHWDLITFYTSVDDEYMRQILDYTEDCTHEDAADSLSGFVSVTIGKRKFGFIKIGADGILN